MEHERIENSADGVPEGVTDEDIVDAEQVDGAEAEDGAPHAESWGAVAVVVLALLGFVAFGNALTAPITYLGSAEVFTNAAVRQFAALPDLAISPHGGVLAPVTYAMNFAMGVGVDATSTGDGPWGFHVLNVLIHIAAGLLLFGLVRRTLLRSGVDWVSERAASLTALAASALWLVHPMQTASVTMIGGRTEVLAGFFVLLSMYGFVRSIDAAFSGAWMIVCVAAAWAGAATGIVAAAVPLLVLLYDRVFASPSIGAAVRGRAWMYAGLAGTWVMAAMMARSSAASLPADPWVDMTWLDYAKVQVWAVPQLIRQALWPDALIMDYGPPGHGVSAGIPPDAYVMHGLIVLALVVLVLVGLLLRPVVGFLGAAVLLPLAPAALVINRVEVVADHRMYLPLAALACAAAVGCAWLTRPQTERCSPQPGWMIAGGLGVAVIAVAVWATMARNAVLGQPAALYADLSKKVSNNPRLLTALSSALMFPREGFAPQLADALRAAERAVQLNPKYAEAHRTMGEALVLAQKYVEAVKPLQEAVRLAPDDVRAQFHLAQDLAKLGRHEEALEAYERTLVLQPEFLAARAQAAAACLETGQRAKGIEYLTQVVAVQPRNAEVLMMLGVALAQEQRFAEAQLVFERILEIDPDNAAVQSNLEKIKARAAGTTLPDAILPGITPATMPATIPSSTTAPGIP